jgi:dihydrofolate reductase
MGRVRVYIASSLDGFIAGPDDDLSWLPTEAVEPEDSGGAVTYEAFIADVGALLMGRRTFEVVHGFEGPWPYDKPVLVVTHRPLPEDAAGGVQAVSGSVAEIVATAREVAGDQDVYVDGGSLVRQVTDAGLVDEWILTLVPTVLGGGHSLFAGVAERHALRVVDVHRYGPMVQLVLAPRA